MGCAVLKRSLEITLFIGPSFSGPVFSVESKLHTIAVERSILLSVAVTVSQ